MICIATEQDFHISADDECLVRIQSQRLVYGQVPFIRYYSDGNGSLLSIMDGVAILYSPSITEEWLVFLEMNPDITTVHCSAYNAAALQQTGRWRGREGDVMIYRGNSQEVDARINTAPSLMDVHRFLSDHFPAMPSLNSWYPDVSHRIRHNRGHIAAILHNEKVVSTALTVAETDSAVILGQIATAPDFRRQGMASRCINALISECKGKSLYILPLNENAKKLYESLGFVTVGRWSELERTH